MGLKHFAPFLSLCRILKRAAVRRGLFRKIGLEFGEGGFLKLIRIVERVWEAIISPLCMMS